VAFRLWMQMQTTNLAMQMPSRQCQSTNLIRDCPTSALSVHTQHAPTAIVSNATPPPIQVPDAYENHFSIALSTMQQALPRPPVPVDTHATCMATAHQTPHMSLPQSMQSVLLTREVNTLPVEHICSVHQVRIKPST